MSGDDRVRQAGAYLRMLLLRPGPYRTAWEERCDSNNPDGIDYTAVACVLSAASSPSEEAVGIAKAALDGVALTADVAGHFVAAFALRPRQAERLSELMRGSPAVRMISGSAQTLEGLRSPLGQPRYESLSLHELHVLGPDGLPAEHQTIQVLRSTVDGLDSVPYRFDTDELAVEVVRGGQVGDKVYRVSDSLYAVDIMLADPLPAGETTLVQYRTTFFYKSPPPPEFRRGALSTVRDLTIWVCFHRDRPPARVWLARWDGVDHARIIEQTPVTLDEELSVHCRFDIVERAVVGFHWEWDT